MRSIRRRLILWLLLGLATLWVAAGAGVYFTVRKSELTRLDAQLEKIDGAARFIIAFGGRENSQRENPSPGRPPSDRGDRSPSDRGPSDRGPRPDREEGGRSSNIKERWPEFFQEDGGNYFQVWNPDGETRVKSISLGEQSMEMPVMAAKEEPRFYDSELPDGTQVRIKAAQFRPPAFGRRPRRPGGGPGNPGGMQPNGPMAAFQNNPEMRFTSAIAIDSSDMRQTLASLLFGIVGVGLAAGAASVGLVHFALRDGLRPLRELGRQVARIDADSLEERFTNDKLPTELAPIYDRLNGLLGRLGASFERERRFSADLAHELRTPVAELRTTAEVALRWPDGGGKETAEAALEIAEQMGDIIESLLALGRYENGQTEIEPESVAVAELGRSCWKPFAGKAAGKGLDVAIDLDEAQTVETDPTMLRLIVSNLFSNAAEYTPDGGKIEISGADGSNGAILRVANSAPGIADGDIPHLFERFWRADGSRTSGSHCGLGLALARACSDVLSLRLDAHVEPGGLLVFDLGQRGAKSSPSSSPRNLAPLS